MRRRNLSKFYDRTNNSLVCVLPQRFLYLLRLLSFIRLKPFLILGTILIISLLTFYVFQITSVISAGYQIQDYKGRLSKLLEENKTLEISAARINSLVDIDGRIRELGFEKMNKVYYIQLFESSVASRNKLP